MQQCPPVCVGPSLSLTVKCTSCDCVRLLTVTPLGEGLKPWVAAELPRCVGPRSGGCRARVSFRRDALTSPPARPASTPTASESPGQGHPKVRSIQADQTAGVPARGCQCRRPQTVHRHRRRALPAPAPAARATPITGATTSSITQPRMHCAISSSNTQGSCSTSTRSTTGIRIRAGRTWCTPPGRIFLVFHAFTSLTRPWRYWNGTTATTVLVLS